MTSPRLTKRWGENAGVIYRTPPKNAVTPLIWVVDGVGIDIGSLFVGVYFVDTLATYASELFGIGGVPFG
jgi:hypothetical protein